MTYLGHCICCNSEGGVSTFCWLKWLIATWTYCVAKLMYFTEAGGEYSLQGGGRGSGEGKEVDCYSG